MGRTLQLSEGEWDALIEALNQLYRLENDEPAVRFAMLRRIRARMLDSP